MPLAMRAEGIKVEFCFDDTDFAKIFCDIKGNNPLSEKVNIFDKLFLFSPKKIREYKFNIFVYLLNYWS